MSDNQKDSETLDKQTETNVNESKDDESNKPKSRKKRQLINAPDYDECLDVNQEYVQCFD